MVIVWLNPPRKAILAWSSDETAAAERNDCISS